VTTETGTTGLPNDADLIRLLRARVRRLEAGIDAHLEALLALGTPVADAWEALSRARRHAAGEPAAGGDESEAFCRAYQESLPKREAAVKALLAAVTQDLREAVLTDEAMTGAQRAKWVALCDAEDAEKAEEHGQ
jgi:hypothetical protein